jgi:hypothetical protein
LPIAIANRDLFYVAGHYWNPIRERDSDAESTAERCGGHPSGETGKETEEEIGTEWTRGKGREKEGKEKLSCCWLEPCHECLAETMMQTSPITFAMRWLPNTVLDCREYASCRCVVVGRSAGGVNRGA